MLGFTRRILLLAINSYLFYSLLVHMVIWYFIVFNLYSIFATISEFTVNEVKVRVCSGYRLPRPILKISFTETLLPVDDEYEVPKRKSVETFMCPINIYNKLLECWNISPDKRPSFNSLYSFIEELLEKEIKKDISTK